MNLKNNLGEMQIKDILETHPPIGSILEKYEIGCIKCSVGICLLKDVVTIHFLGDDAEANIEKEINTYIDSLTPVDIT